MYDIAMTWFVGGHVIFLCVYIQIQNQKAYKHSIGSENTT